VTREQLLANRYGVATKGAGPLGGRRHDYTWAGAGVVAVVVLGLALGGLQNSQTSAGSLPPARSGASTGSGAGVQVKPTTALGDVSSFATIANDLQAQVRQERPR